MLLPEATLRPRLFALRVGTSRAVGGIFAPTVEI